MKPAFSIKTLFLGILLVCAFCAGWMLPPPITSNDAALSVAAHMASQTGNSTTRETTTEIALTIDRSEIRITGSAATEAASTVSPKQCHAKFVARMDSV